MDPNILDHFEPLFPRGDVEVNGYVFPIPCSVVLYMDGDIDGIPLPHNFIGNGRQDRIHLYVSIVPYLYGAQSSVVLIIQVSGQVSAEIDAK